MLGYARCARARGSIFIESEMHKSARSSMPTLLDPRHCPGQPHDRAPATPGFIVEVPGFFAEHECKQIITAAEAAGLKPAPTSDRQPKKNEAYLDRDTARLHDDALVAAIWQRLAPLLPRLENSVPIGLHSDGPPTKGRDGKLGRVGELKVYRYTKGHRFDQHVDQSWKSGEPGEETEFTFLVYLSGSGEVAQGSEQPLIGGDTVFWASAKKELVRCTPRTGTAVLHAHGRRCLMHQGEEVTRGIKWLLRADVMYRRELPANIGQPQPHPVQAGAGAGRPGGRGHVGKGKQKHGGPRSYETELVLARIGFPARVLL